MIAACPNCQAKVSIDNDQLDDDRGVACPGCQSTLRAKLIVEVIDSPERHLPSLDEASDVTRKVLICIDGEGTRDLIKEVLDRSKITVVDVPSGEETLPSIRRHRPAVAMIDMGFPGTGGAELCGEIKKDPDLQGTAVMLVASMYDKMGKRHEPAALFGADDYIDRYLIQKGLLEKIENLLDKEEKVGGTDRAPSAVMEGTDEAINQASDIETGSVQESPLGVEEESAEEKNAKRLARIIVSDIALYNQKRVDEGIQNDTFHELLQEEIEEGRKHYLSRVSEDLPHAMDYFEEAFEDYIKKRKSSHS
ncbi:MAG: response regulator [Nitrospiria bacterium]